MSILLEALRKSEKNQHSHETPTIHSEDQSTAVSEPLQIGPLTLLLVAALFVSGWFVWRQYQLPSGSEQPAASQAADNVRAVTPPVVVDEQGAQPAPASTIANTPREQKRTPVESFQPSAGDVSLKEQGKAGRAAGDPIATAPAANKQPASNAAAVAGTQVSKSAASDSQVRSQPEKYHPGEPAPISYWELPDAVRSDVPEIKFSVLVYATDPDDRFVLINGQRLKQGDSAQPGLVVQEIRRDGVIFSYRLYQFLVER